jgi:large subunit ribosomal protein L29
MEAYEIRNLTESEIITTIEENQEELFNLRFQLAIGQVKDSNRISALKRDIARLKTILRERELAALQ